MSISKYVAPAVLTLTLLVSASVFPLPAYAQQDTITSDQQSALSQVPLVVIRYNQPKVFYQRQLYNAVSRAVAIKPDVVFQVVSFVPVTNDSERDEAAALRAKQQTATLLKDMASMGIPPERIRVTRETAKDTRLHEVYIYVD
jgi:hypothetical protein